MSVKTRFSLKLNLFQILALSSLFIGSLWLTSCTLDQSLHQTYTYKGPAGFYDVTSQKSIAIQWQPQPGPKVAASQPDPIVFRADLIGPFLSVNSLLKWAKQDSASSTPNMQFVIVSAPLQKTDTWTNRSMTSYVPVPTQLPPGLYDLRYMITVQTQTHNSVTRADALINIHCPENAPCH